MRFASTPSTPSPTSRPLPFLEELAEAVHRQAEALGAARLPLRRKAMQRCPPDSSPLPRAATAWTPNGATIFITRCAHCSPAKTAAITTISAAFDQVAKA